MRFLGVKNFEPSFFKTASFLEKNESMTLIFVLNERYNPGLSLNTKEDLTNMLSEKILQLDSQGGKCEKVNDFLKSKFFVK